MNDEIDINIVRDLCDKMILKYGKQKQLYMVIQELAELIQAITKLYQIGVTNETLYGRHGVFKESSDVWLMLQQLETIFDDKELWRFNKQFVINNALERLKN
jgi:hypothetical protein